MGLLFLVSLFGSLLFDVVCFRAGNMAEGFVCHLFCILDVCDIFCWSLFWWYARWVGFGGFCVTMSFHFHTPVFVGVGGAFFVVDVALEVFYPHVFFTVG